MKTIKHMIKDRNTGKRLSNVFINGKGWYRWNSAFHVYNNVDNYEQLHNEDLPNMNHAMSYNHSLRVKIAS